MQIVIDISEDVFTRLFDAEVNESFNDQESINAAVRKGYVLPKGHGKLVDADEIIKKYKKGNWDLHKVLRSAPAIIEADKEEA